MDEFIGKWFVKYIRTHGIRVVSVVGAGGKTSTVFSLKDAWKDKSANGEALMITTTTAMFEPSKSDVDHLVFAENYKTGEIINHLDFLVGQESFNSKSIGLFDGRIEFDDHIKVKGINPLLIDLISETQIFELIVAEADGAKRKSMKAYEIHEPVIPESTDLVIVVLGLSVLNKEIKEDTIHRSANFLKLTGKKEGDIFEISDMPMLFKGDMGFLRGVPKNSDVFVFLNQCDSIDENELNEGVFDEILKIDERIKGILVGSMQKDRYIRLVLKK